MKKKLALMLALLMLGTVAIAGCKKNENADGTNSDGNNTQVEQNGTEGTSDFVAPEIVTTDYDKFNIIKVNDNEYSAALYRCMLYQVADYLGGTDPAKWEQAAGEEMKYWNSLLEIFAEYGVTLSDSDYQQIYDLRDQTIEKYEGDTAAYYEELDMLHMTEKVYIDRIAHYIYNEKFAQVFVDQFSPEEQDILDFVHENYVRVKHILIKTEGLDDSQKAEARSRADRVLERAKAGESFEALVKEISEDGMDPDLGYYFTTGKMVPEFEEASFALEEGGISDIVESQYGYHIIKRYSMEDEHILSNEEVRYEAEAYLCNLLYSDMVNEAIANAELEYLDAFEETNNEMLAEYLASKNITIGEKDEEASESEEKADASEESAAA